MRGLAGVGEGNGPEGIRREGKGARERRGRFEERTRY